MARRAIWSQAVATVLSVGLAGALSAVAGEPGGILQQKKPNRNFEEGVDFTVPNNETPAGNAVADVTSVAFESTNSGCDADHFASFRSGTIALVRRGGCLFATKVLNAIDAGASGVLIANNVDTLTSISLAGAHVDVPVLFVSKDVGAAFDGAADSDELLVHMLVRKER